MTGLPIEWAYQASIAVPSSAVVNAASTASQDRMSARSPSTISASCPTVRPRKSRRIGSTGSWPASRRRASARLRYSSANGGPARYTRTPTTLGPVSEEPVGGVSRARLRGVAERLARLPLVLEAVELTCLERPGRGRATTLVRARGAGEEGLGEDVTFQADDTWSRQVESTRARVHLVKTIGSTK